MAAANPGFGSEAADAQRTCSAPTHGLAARFFTSLILAGLLTGCAVGPEFIRPQPPETSRNIVAALPAQTVSTKTPVEEAQPLPPSVEVNTPWWKKLESPRLDALIEQAFERSPSLAAARATLRQAQELHSAQAGSTLYPQVDAGLGAQRQRMSPGALGQTGDAREFSLYNTSVAVHYRLDLAGGNRRALEALAARADYRRHELAGARLTLAASMAGTAILRARLAAQISTTQALIDAQEEQIIITQARVRLGQAAPDELLSLKTLAVQTRAGLPLLRKQLDQSEHLLATLSGQAPGSADVPDFTLDEFKLPSDLPVVLTSEQVRQRPDIQAAEALLHAATADYGVAVARLYPQINLSANLGAQALTTGALFGGGSAVWSVLGQLTQPLFNPGLPAEKRASLAALDAAAAQYQGVVLDALRNVADILRALDHDAQSRDALAAADAFAQSLVDSLERQYALGAASYTQLLLARQQKQQHRLALLTAQAQNLLDSVALYQASGGDPGRPGHQVP